MDSNKTQDTSKLLTIDEFARKTSKDFWRIIYDVIPFPTDSDPDILWHYTDLNGLVSIVENGVLWSSSAFHTNDKKEIFHASNRFHEYCEKKGYINSQKRDAHTASLFDALVRNHQIVDSESVFISCFCENPDLLSQWTHYGGANGVAIGFQREELIKSCNTPFFEDRQSSLDKVCYNENDLNKAIELGTELILNNFRNHPNEDPFIDHDGNISTIYSDRFAILTRNAMDLLFPIFKDSAFESEREWRIMSHHPADSKLCKFRSRNGLLLPYIEYGKHCWKRLPIVEVKVGPSPEKDLNRETVAAFLRSRDYGRVAVSMSSVPYRG